MITRLAYSMSRKVQKLTTAENASDSSQPENSLVGTISYSKMSFTSSSTRCASQVPTAVRLVQEHLHLEVTFDYIRDFTHIKYHRATVTRATCDNKKTTSIT